MLKHLFWFSSRANRTEKLFWLLILSTFSWLLTLFTPQPMLPLTAARMITWLVVMLLLLPVWWLGITLSVRRLHDMNLSGWWLLGIIILGIFLNLVTMFAFPALAGTVLGIGGLVLSAVFLSVPGTAGANRFGTYDKHYYPAFMDRRAVWIFCVILFAVSQVTATVRTVKQARASQKRMMQFQQVVKMQQQMQEQYRQQLMQVQGQEPLSDEEKIKLFKEQIQKMQEQIRQQYEQQMQQQQQAQNKRSKSL